MRFYRVDLADLGSLRFSWRRLGVLLSALPPDSALAVAQNGGPSWGESEWLLAVIANVLRAVYRNPKGPAPAPILPPVARLEERRKRRDIMRRLVEFDAKYPDRR